MLYEVTYKYGFHIVEKFKGLENVYRQWLRLTRRNSWLGWYYERQFLFCCTCMLLRLLENGVITVCIIKSKLCLCDSYDEELYYYDYYVSPMLIKYVLCLVMNIWCLNWILCLWLCCYILYVCLFMTNHFVNLLWSCDCN